MMISLKYVLAPCHFCSKFLETSSKNLCAWTTVVIIHIDRTINHRFICTSGSYMSPHTQYTQLHNSQVNFYRKGGPRAKADLPNLLASMQIYCARYVFTVSGGFFLCSGSLCYRYPERPGKKLLLTEGLHQVGRKCNVPRTLGLASKHKLHQGYTTIVLTVLFVDHYSATSFSKKNYLLQRVSLQLFDKTQMKHKVSGKSKL